MTYSELIDVVRCQYSPAVLESVQFETNKGGIDADNLYWDMWKAGSLASVEYIEVVAWPTEADSKDDEQRGAFRSLFALDCGQVTAC